MFDNSGEISLSTCQGPGATLFRLRSPGSQAALWPAAKSPLQTTTSGLSFQPCGPGQVVPSEAGPPSVESGVGPGTLELMGVPHGRPAAFTSHVSGDPGSCRAWVCGCSGWADFSPQVLPGVLLELSQALHAWPRVWPCSGLGGARVDPAPTKLQVFRAVAQRWV